jgi:NAD-dependent DNA ligase
LMVAPKEELLQVEGVGEQVASSLQEFFASERNQALIRKLREAGVRE